MIGQIKKRILKLVPLVHVNNSSQTIYECLLGSIKMYQVTKQELWKERCDRLLSILIDIQCDDGGFDIGYDFNFGYKHNKGESTSPEMISLIALCLYAKEFNYRNELRDNVTASVNWIKEHSREICSDMWAIPYGPHSTNNIVVYNGTSFVCSALGVYLGVYGKNDESLVEIYEGMINYLYHNMHSDEDLEDEKFWYYNVSKESDKIDYYHQMQQVEVHSIANSFMPSDVQEKIIKQASRFIHKKCQSSGSIINYTNDSSFSNRIHVWGLCSVASGLVHASAYEDDLSISYKDEAVRIWQFIINKSWNGQYFSPILENNGDVYDSRFYVRSDSWVFNSLASFYCISGKDPFLLRIINDSYRKMEECSFSGIENHASSMQRRLVLKSIDICLKFLRKIK
ncbi:hypothetical protein K5X82_18665 [Halosquirtibacter xylanolyticus]|uniref:hypothetical protein n=1 Tax=Halosquirtibacter xylanolyticus TaxID=3374599 RepID=UPI003749305F|nr:hypothetical protein K5X82_18665 [Prolixibacteraceae bacterium]